MSGTAMMPVPSEEPKEKYIRVSIASLQIVYSDRDYLDDLGEIDLDDLNIFKELLLKPAFVKAQEELRSLYKDQFEITNIELKNGSIIVEAILSLLIAVGNQPIIVVAAGGVLASIVTKKILTPSDASQYKLAMDKISTIIKSHAESLAGQDFKTETYRTPVYNPKLKQYELQKFEFHSTDLEKLKRDVEVAIDNYHKHIDKI